MASLFRNFHNFKNRAALIGKDNKIVTYSNLLNIFNSLEQIFKKKSTVLIISDNSLGSIINYVFCIRSKHVAILISNELSNSEIKEIIKIYKPNFIVSEKKIFAKEFSLKKKYSLYKTILFSTSFINHNFNKKLQLLLPTSGSMGSAKFVMLSEQNLYSNTMSIIKYLKLKNHDRAITNMPFYYSYMLSIINTHLQVGGSIVVSKETIVQKKFWEIYSQLKITSFNGVPYIYEIINKIGIKKIFTKSLRYITQAGGKLDEKLVKKILKFTEKKKKDFYIMYGQTEASPRISYLKRSDIKRKIGSIGRPIEGVKMLLKNKKTIIKKPFSEGTIFCKGKNIMIGYASSYKDLKKHKKISELDTGDIGFFDEENFYFIKSRSKRIAKFYGIRLDLDELEKKMLKLGFVVRIACNDNKIGIFYNPRKKIKPIMIKNKINKITNQNFNTMNFIKLLDVPRTPNKKVNYNKLQKML
tara:strand:+ start:19027 stop:20436 length:1410 start_codon:yes stop_codon:yes gene_type:complete